MTNDNYAMKVTDIYDGSVLTDYRILKNYAKTLTGAGV